MKTNTSWNEDFAKRLRDARIAAGLNQSQASRLLECSQSYISMMEAGNRMPEAPIISRMCDVYEVDANWLLGLTDESDLDPKWIEELRKLSPADRVKTRKLLTMIGA